MFNRRFAARKLIRNVFLISLGMVAGSAHSRIYRYVDSETGSTIYSNVQPRLRLTKPEQTTLQPARETQLEPAAQATQTPQTMQAERDQKHAQKARKAQLAREARLARKAQLAQEARKAQEAQRMHEVQLAQEIRKAQEARKARELQRAREVQLAHETQRAQDTKLVQETNKVRKAEPTWETEDAPQLIPTVRQQTSVTTEDSPKRIRASIHRVSAPATSTRGNFPRVTAATQRERDAERRRILGDELQAEQAAMNDAIARHATDEVIHRHQENVAALERELGNKR